jgi:hypothetical protein
VTPINVKFAHYKELLKAMNEKVEYKDITFQISVCEGFPVLHTITSAEQKEFVDSGYGTVSDLIEFEKSSYRDWQADC